MILWKNCPCCLQTKFYQSQRTRVYAQISFQDHSTAHAIMRPVANLYQYLETVTGKYDECYLHNEFFDFDVWYNDIVCAINYFIT